MSRTPEEGQGQEGERALTETASQAQRSTHHRRPTQTNRRSSSRAKSCWTWSGRYRQQQGSSTPHQPAAPASSCRSSGSCPQAARSRQRLRRWSKTASGAGSRCSCSGAAPSAAAAPSWPCAGPSYPVVPDGVRRPERHGPNRTVLGSDFLLEAEGRREHRGLKRQERRE